MPGGITGFFNIFSIDDDVMKYNEKLMKEDIDKYVEELKTKLLKEFEKNNNLTIR